MGALWSLDSTSTDPLDPRVRTVFGMFASTIQDARPLVSPLGRIPSLPPLSTDEGPSALLLSDDTRRARRSSRTGTSTTPPYTCVSKTLTRIRTVALARETENSMRGWTFPLGSRTPHNADTGCTADGPIRPRLRTQSTPFRSANTTAAVPTHSFSPSASAPTRGRVHRRSLSIHHTDLGVSPSRPPSLPRHRRRPRSPSPPTQFRYSSPPPPVPPIPAAVLKAVKEGAAARDSVVSFTARATRLSRQKPVMVSTPPATPPSTPPPRESPRLDPMSDENIAEIVDSYVLDDLEPLSPATPTQESTRSRHGRGHMSIGGRWTCADFLGIQEGSMRKVVLA